MRLSPTLLLLPLLTLFPPTSSVDVSFYSEGPLTVIDGFVHGRGPGTWTITCANLLPGQCCRLPGPSWITSRSTKGVTFTNLGANHIAAVWVRNRDMGLPGPSHGDCNDVVHRSSAGPGTWRWFDWMRRVDVPHGFQIVPVHATGGSYIQMPVRLPPDTGTANWLEAEGLLGLVWGGGKWFASTAASRLLGGEADPGGSGVVPRSQLKRGIRSKDKGTVYATSPKRAVYPRFLTVNGTDYTDGGKGDLVYKSADGALLDLRH